MDELKHITLAHLAELAKRSDELFSNNYISQNLAVVRHLVPQFIKDSQFVSLPSVLNEKRIIVIQRGWSRCHVNLMEHLIKAGDLMYCDSNSLFQLLEVSDDVSGFVFSLKEDLFRIIMGNNVPQSFDGSLRDFHIQIQTQDIEFLERIHRLLYESLKSSYSGYPVTSHLVGAFLWFVDQLRNRQEITEAVTLTREQQLFHDFIQLVNTHTPQERSLSFYASNLFLSPRYVSTLIMQASGKHAKNWIDEAVILKIKIALKHTSKTISQIADEMDFPNVSFFCKYFRHLTKMTPSAYRKKIIQ